MVKWLGLLSHIWGTFIDHPTLHNVSIQNIHKKQLEKFNMLESRSLYSHVYCSVLCYNKMYHMHGTLCICCDWQAYFCLTL
jgi:hypothetical protein